ncbi:MAG: exodeoxyribonuclease VII large subunit [Candidatus Velthaea sp.]
MRAANSAAPYPVVSVGRLANYITRKLTDDPKLKWVGVRGELSGLSIQANGNVYFNLKDRDALIKVVVWSESAATLPPLANGQDVIAVGNVATYVKNSSYQLVAVNVEQGGIGRLHAIYEDLRRRLDAEGLFAQARKRRLPRFPFHVGLISSRTANGAGDFLTQAAALAPHVTITLFETSVQGANAASEIVRAIERASRSDVDVVIIARGGGSYEDLFVFSDERVVRALAASRHPTISAIGHEADAPLTDFVADMRAATPSTAAQTFLPRRNDILSRLATDTSALDRCLARSLERARKELSRIDVRSPLADGTRLLAPRRQAVDVAQMDLRRNADRRLRAAADRLGAFAHRLDARNPSVQLEARRQKLTFAAYKLERAAVVGTLRSRSRLQRALERLNAVAVRPIERRHERLRLAWAHLSGKDPTAILERGYAIVRLDGRAVRDAALVPPGAVVTAQIARGTLTARVESSETNGGE